MIAIQTTELVPEEFRPHQIRNYPADNEVTFEEWLYKYERYTVQPETERVYLGVGWTNFYNNHRHGKDRRALRRLQEFLDRLDRKKKYWTVVQNDDGILNDVKHLDLKVFGMGCKGDVQLPLVCQPHKYEFKETGRPIFASFVGSITHPIREQMVKELHGKEGYFISTEPTSLHSYCYIMSQSKFVLCPRGYGKTSFRIQEALQYGCKPIYISDEHLFAEGTIESTIELFLQHEEAESKVLDINPCVNKCIYETFYTYEAVANRIYENL